MTARLIFITTLLFLFVTSPVIAQEIPVDIKGREYISSGKNQLEKKNWIVAAGMFNKAAELPFHQQTTEALYFSGYSYYKAGDFDVAEAKFNKLLLDYPQSRFADDAVYHLSIMDMQSKSTLDREQGLNKMFNVWNTTEDERLKEDALNSIRHYMFTVYDRTFLNVYNLFVEDEFKPFVIEAIAYKLAEEGESRLLMDLLEDYYEEGGKPTKFMKSLEKKYEAESGFSGTVGSSGELKIAVVLPFNLHLTDTAKKIPQKSKLALEFYEGAIMAADSFMLSNDARIHIKAFDTRNDTFFLKKQMSDIESFKPDVIIGGIYNQSSEFLARWAEQKQILQIIPLSPSSALIKDRKNVFLFHPSVATHGKKLAEFTVGQQNVQNISIIFEKNEISRMMAMSFYEKATALGATVDTFAISANYEIFKEQTSGIVKQVKYKNPQAVYIPVTSEESAGLIISQMNYNHLETRILGSPDWEYFYAIDEELLEKYQLTYTTPYFKNNDSLAFENMRFTYADIYGEYPSQFVLHGFDLMTYVLNATRLFNPHRPLREELYGESYHHLIHQDVLYDGFQDNQVVNIIQNIEGKLVRLNGRK